jgi:hypothetical protein
MNFFQGLGHHLLKHLTIILVVGSLGLIYQACHPSDESNSTGISSEQLNFNGQ